MQYANDINIEIFGESHGEEIGCVITNLPAGVKIDAKKMQYDLSLRAPGNDPTATTRKEADTPVIVSGVLDGVTTGAPLTIIIKNTNTHSTDYSGLKDCPRPSHSDYAAFVKYDGFNDIRGGGNFSGRLTAPLVAAGSLCESILNSRDIWVGGHILKIGNVEDKKFDATNVTKKDFEKLNKFFAVNDEECEEKMREVIAQAKYDGDSIGGAVELCAVGLPAGVGSPMFYGVENVVSQYLFAVPAVKAIEFGAGKDFAEMLGSQANDQMYYDDQTVKTYSNNCGGILGGITNGMPITVSVTLKPTPSIAKPQKTVNLKLKENTELVIHGRHDPCIVARALPALKAALCVALVKLLAKEGKL